MLWLRARSSGFLHALTSPASMRSRCGLRRSTLTEQPATAEDVSNKRAWCRSCVRSAAIAERLERRTA